MENSESEQILGNLMGSGNGTDDFKDGAFTRHSGQFNVYDRRQCQQCTPYRRRDFYKITLIESSGMLHYAEKGIEINRPTLLFSNPMIPYSWEAGPGEQKGYFCIFTQQFLLDSPGLGKAMQAPFYFNDHPPVYFLDQEQRDSVREIFLRMQAEFQSDYADKFNLLHHYVQILIHEARKLEPARSFFKHKNAASRITSLFLDLLDRQFPIDESGQVVLLKKAADFAAQLSVHVNHLNRAVKEVTGKTTSTLIAERIIQEAKSLLLHTDWNINEVGYSLGFEYPSYFNNFFRKQTSLTPVAFRS